VDGPLERASCEDSRCRVAGVELKLELTCSAPGWPIVVSLWMRPMPVPRRFDNAAQIRVSGLPAQLALGLLGGRYQRRRVARAARGFLRVDLLAGHVFDRADYFADAVPAANAKVVASGRARLQSFQRQEVGVGQVVHVDVVADAGAVGRGI